jgi:hypothetical protein
LRFARVGAGLVLRRRASNLAPHSANAAAMGRPPTRPGGPALVFDAMDLAATPGGCFPPPTVDGHRVLVQRMEPCPARWLPALGVLTADDIAKTYWFEGQFTFIDDNRTRIEWIHESANLSDIGWRVFFFRPNGAPVNRVVDGKPLPIERMLYESGPLRHDMGPMGKAAHNLLLCLEEDCRNHGLGGLLAEREHMLFMLWGAQQLLVDAACEAKENGHWLKRGFEPSYGLKLALEDRWSDYLAARPGGTNEQVGGLPVNWDDWPKEFRTTVCREFQLLQLYKGL